MGYSRFFVAQMPTGFEDISINRKAGSNMKVTVKRKTKAGSSTRHIPGDNRWRNVQGKSGYRNLNQRKMIRAALNPRSVRKGA